ncbi:F-box domain [Arabidopsis thaliana x Arabidopsis arenosa]|uniref:F-box domain n=1 Tax=Arabidopsis thaliana x Arabidopsis arenosa TaxID=1240361 RepID=A0A8T1YCX7_9BRAS|nr:F-box domain [Arabidopsis thaliana x Arabidopsis arenosa]
MDLLRNLPDELLCHILSFLTTKEAALTSVLSKRWRNLLAFVPNLDIEDNVFLYPEMGKCDRDDIRQLFMEFVDRVLALQGNSPIKKFSINCVGVDSDRVDAWIHNVMVRGVSELHLSIVLDILPVGKKFWVPPKCFESKKLVKLEIGYGVDIGWLDGSFFLPMLKTLVLSLVRLSADTFEILLHDLPALEELAMGTFSVDTPSLVYFSYSDYVAKDYPVVKMENLFEARISLLVTEDQIERARAPNNDWLVDDDDGNVVLRFANVWKLMNGIQNVQYLDLSANTLEVLSLCCESMPVFKNLKYLSIKSEESRGWQAMPVLLRNCPHLKTLVLEGLLHHVTDKCGDACDCVSREDRGRSLTSCPVKVLEIKGFQGTTKEMHMIKHFLDYFPCLKETKIYMEENDPTQLKVTEVSEVIAEKMELNNKSSSCNIQLLLSGGLYKKWTAK